MRDRWLLRGAQQAAGLRLFCLPHAGGGAAGYLSWAGSLGCDVMVCPIQLPGRENRLAEAPIADMSAIATAIVAAIGHGLADPFAIYGHSMGAHVAFELARELRRRDWPAPRCLIVSGARAPHLPPTRPLLCELADDELLATVGVRYGSPVEPEMMALMRLMLPTLRADLGLVERHVHATEPPLTLPLVALAGADDHSVPLPDARQWGRHTSEAFEFKTFPGGHFFPSTGRATFLAHLGALLAPHLPAGRS